MKKASPRDKPTGPVPKRLAIPGNWKQAVAQAMANGKPPAPAKTSKGRRAKGTADPSS